MPEIADSLVVGVELPDEGYYMPLFVVPAPGVRVDEPLCAKIRESLRRELSPRHVPDEIISAPAVPRTLPGKKLEVPVKRLLQQVPIDWAVAAAAVDRPRAPGLVRRPSQATLRSTRDRPLDLSVPHACSSPRMAATRRQRRARASASRWRPRSRARVDGCRRTPGRAATDSWARFTIVRILAP